MSTLEHLEAIENAIECGSIFDDMDEELLEWLTEPRETISEQFKVCSLNDEKQATQGDGVDRFQIQSEEKVKKVTLQMTFPQVEGCLEPQRVLFIEVPECALEGNLLSEALVGSPLNKALILPEEVATNMLQERVKFVVRQNNRRFAAPIDQTDTNIDDHTPASSTSNIENSYLTNLLDEDSLDTNDKLIQENDPPYVHDYFNDVDDLIWRI